MRTRPILFGAVLLLSAASAARAAPLEIVIDLGLDDDRLGVYLVGGDTVFRSYPLAAPRHTPQCLYHRDVTGVITAIDRHAAWVPTAATKASMARKGKHLRDRYPPGSRGNALGSRKFVIAWNNPCFQGTVRLHGTNRPRYVRERRRVSRNCFRMLNADWSDLAAVVAVGTRVRVTGTFKP